MRTLLFQVFTLQTFTLILTYCINDSRLATELYNNVNEALYDEAVAQTKTLQQEGKPGSIFQTVYKLLDNNVNNTIHYAYRLWVAGKKQIVIEYFPRAFKLIFNEDDVKILNSKTKHGFKLDKDASEDGDRLLYMDNTEANALPLNWRFEPFWEHNRVYFRIKNLERNMYIKRDTKKIENIYWGDSSQVADDIKLTWALKPNWRDGKMFFRFVDQKYMKMITEEVDKKYIGEWIIEDSHPDVFIYKQV